MENGNIIFKKKAIRKRKKIWENDKMNGNRMKLNGR